MQRTPLASRWAPAEKNVFTVCKSTKNHRQDPDSIVRTKGLWKPLFYSFRNIKCRLFLSGINSSLTAVHASPQISDSSLNHQLKFPLYLFIWDLCGLKVYYSNGKTFLLLFLERNFGFFPLKVYTFLQLDIKTEAVKLRIITELPSRPWMLLSFVQ